MTDQQKAFEMFAAGDSVTRVAKVLFNNNWGKTKKLMEQYEAQGVAEPGADGGEAAAAEDEAAEGQTYDLVLKMPATQIPAVFAGFSMDEQAYAVQSVLQLRMEAEA